MLNRAMFEISDEEFNKYKTKVSKTLDDKTKFEFKSFKDRIIYERRDIVKKKIVAIGGGENGRLLEDGTFAPYNTQKIDEEIVKLSNKENPHFLFINHAMPSLKVQESYFQTMQKIYG